jgi:ABC-type uncharacterized transport system involved in gliding motility auxiliary subunit
MALFSQMLGITGAILVLYSILAYALTPVATWFFWTLIGAGVACLAVFVLTSLNRSWQKVIGLLVAFNIPWVAIVLTRNMDFWGKMLGEAVVSEKRWVAYGITGLVFLLNGLFFFLSWRLLKEVFQKRSLRYGTSAAIYSVFAIAALIVANVVSSDFNWQKDFTENQVNVLTDQSLKALNGLKTNLKITAFFDQRNQLKPLTKTLLSQYKDKSNKVEVNFVDPDQEKLLAERFNVKDGDIVVEYGGQSHVTSTATEESITQAILKVVRTETPTACFTQGHGELKLDGPEDDPTSLSISKGGLENEGFKTKALESLASGMPSDCSVVVVAGPTVRFPASEVTVLDTYLAEGGHAIFMLGPNLPDPRLKPTRFDVQPTGLESLMKTWGVELGNNIIVQSRVELFRGVVIDGQIATSNYGNHPVVDSLKGKQTLFNQARSVRKVDGFTGTAVELISSVGEGASVAVADIDALVRTRKLNRDDKRNIIGPISFAVAVEKQNSDTTKKPTRLVVFGTNEFASNNLIRSNEFNFDLVLNALNWLGGTTEQISIRPKRLRASSIELTSDQMTVIFYVAIILIPMIVLVFGINLWWFRRRRG